jgi:hypothetical protein
LGNNIVGAPHASDVVSACSENDTYIKEMASVIHPLDSKKRAIGVLKAYMDESGVKNDPHIFAMGGCVAKEKDWSLWSQQWKSILKNPGEGKKEIEYMHMAECVHRCVEEAAQPTLSFASGGRCFRVPITWATFGIEKSLKN